MNKRSLKPYASVAAIAIFLVLITNPELRALLLLADAIGPEAILFLVLVQLKIIWPVVANYTLRRSEFLCPVVTRLVRNTVYISAGLLWSIQSVGQPTIFVSNRLWFVRCPGRPGAINGGKVAA